MRIFLIDLGGLSPDNLQAYLAKHEIVTGQTNASGDNYDAVIIGGTEQSAGAIETVQSLPVANTTKPVIGIGSAGFELACGLAGVEIAKGFEQGSGACRLVPTDDGAKLFQGTDPILVKESRRWLVDELPKSLQVLARTEDVIEAFRHKQKPLAAIQQLPEDFVYPSDAKLVYGNIFGLFGRM